ncbi:MAG: Na+/H+ antiporter NhaC family protein [Longimicrobiales bacterium]
MSDPSWISLLPPLLAITLAIISRQVYLSLAGGIWLGWTILEGWDPISGLASAIDGSVEVLSDPGDAKVILFTLVIGALIATVETSGGVRGFVGFLESRRWVDTPRKARILAWLIGITLFIESNINVLVAGSVSRPLFDRFKISREKLAYIIDSASAPTCILIPLNAWGAYNLGILSGLGVEDPLRVFLSAVVLNFYAMAALALAFFTAVTDLDLGPMKKAQKRTREGEVLWPNATPMIDESILSPQPNEKIPPRAVNMILPIVVMVLMMPISLFITGGGDLMEGEGSTSVLWAVMSGLAVAWVLLLVQRGSSVDDLTRTGLKGAGGLIPLALILFLALSLGDVANALGTGRFVAQVTEGVLPPFLFLPLVFLVGAGIAFSIGSSWGTFAIMLPIAVPAGEAMGLPLAPFVAASLAGGVFGDHSSPISDTTIISSMAAATDHIDHVRTQLPYALSAGAVALVGFALLGATL